MAPVRRKLREKMRKAEFEQIAAATDELLERRRDTVVKLTDVAASGVNLNPFLMLALAPTYNIFSPYEAAEYVQEAKLHHGDATAFGKFVENHILPPFGVTVPPEKKRDRTLFSPIDAEATIDGTRYLMTFKSGPWTMNQSHANEMISTFPRIHRELGCPLLIGIFYGTRERLNNKPRLVETNTGPYVSTLVDREFWEFITGVRNAHTEIFRAIREAQRRFAERHGGRTVFEQKIEARLTLANSIRSAFDLVGQEVDMWEQIFEGSF